MTFNRRTAARLLAWATCVGAAPPAAMAAPCPFTDIGSIVGSPALQGSTCGLGNTSVPSCNASGTGEDVSFTWRAPGTGTYRFSTVGSALDTVLAVADGSCGATSLGCHTDASSTGATLSGIVLTVGQTVTISIDGTSGCGAFVLGISGTWCGNGVREGAEACDDSNTTAGDGCSATCTLEGTCGNGSKEAGEECDDGLLNSDIQSDACRRDCTLARCGDGVVDLLLAELCDDGNNLDDDGCSAACVPEAGGCPSVELGTATGALLWQGNTCGLGDREAPSCIKGGGDGDDLGLRWQAPATGVYTFTSAGSLIDTALAIRSGTCAGSELACASDTLGRLAVVSELWLTAGERVVLILDSEDQCGDAALSIFGRYCGNGVRDSGEQCDDGAEEPGDGCSATCTLETSCGNGSRTGSEQCDDGNLRNGDGCSSTCTLESAPFCGNEITEGEEECDEGPANSDTEPDACRSDCTSARCGDGVRDTGEECDDGNPFVADGCEPDCTRGQGACPAEDLLSALGTNVFLGSSCDRGAFFSGSCGGGGDEVTLLWSAPETGSYTFSTAGSAIDTVLYARAGSCGGAELACSDNAIDLTSEITALPLTAGDTLVLFLDSRSSCGQVALSIRKTRCGNGVLEPGEACDDGDAVVGDGCSAGCALESCGNGSVADSEECDAGGDNSDSEPDACRTDCREHRCGDGVVDTGEECDDGNLASLDGCDAGCAAEPWACPFYDLASNLDNATTGAPVLAIETCGFGADMTPACAPGATGEDVAILWTAPATGAYDFHTLASKTDTVLSLLSGDCAGPSLGCSDDLPGTEASVLPGVALTAGDKVVIWVKSKSGCGPVTLSITSTACGDGEVDELNGEECDDHNTDPDDGCSDTCLYELTSCGDGLPNLGEECDEGDSNSDTEPDACRESCHLPRCGDGVTDAGEECDDGDLVPHDGCSPLCEDETQSCVDADLGSTLTYIPFVGDSCEGTARMGASCSARAAAEPENNLWWTAPGRGRFRFAVDGVGMAPVLVLRGPSCIGPELSCASADPRGRAATALDMALGESVLLTVDSRGQCGEYALRIEGSYCGDGRVDPLNGESCDDGNDESGDGCDSNCVRELSRCGNGMSDTGEACDAGDANSDLLADACRTNCQRPHCGDWVQDTGEECDDGNLFTGDGCNSTCAIEPTWCPFADLGSAVGPTVATGDTCVSGNHTRGSCGGMGGGDLAYSWRAPYAGAFVFALLGTSYPAAVFVRAGGCAGEELACGWGASATTGELRLLNDATVTVVVDGNHACGDYTLAVRSRHCGDGTPDFDLGEQCDDGNGVDDDDCSNLCRARGPCGDGNTDLGEECDDGLDNSDELPNACRTDCHLPACGDGVPDNGEECDNGLGNSDESPDACRTDCHLASCGDGVIDSDESCDDGNSDETDGCGNDCQRTPGTCGDGHLNLGEACDRGPLNSNSEPDACRKDCTNPRCGDSVQDTGEECDQGPGNDDHTPDACRAFCLDPRCGDGVRDSGEECDDGNTRGLDGCDGHCQIEPPPSCGNGLVEPGEACDRGSENSDTEPDRCRTNCQVSHCGDGVTDQGEACDDGGSNSNSVSDACRLSCTLPRCGDAVVDFGEFCDDGNTGAGDGCDESCQPEMQGYCGDGERQGEEACDDGNRDAGDGCSPTCRYEGVAGDVDGDGIPDASDNCKERRNQNQEDMDRDGTGDACDDDIDGDGLDLAAETAAGSDPLVPDSDGDGILDGADNCPVVINRGQRDLDRDGIGDECDLDRDGDKVDDASDNCTGRYNPNQNDNDQDGVGDYCDDSPQGGCNSTGASGPAALSVLLVLALRRRRQPPPP